MRTPGSAQWQRREESAEAMGATFTLILYGQEAARLEAAVEEAFRELRRLEEMLSPFRPESEWSRVNLHAERGVPVSPELFQLLSRCQEFSRHSQGAFDISIGPLMEIWRASHGEERNPWPEEMASACRRVGFSFLQLNPEGREVRFLRPGMRLDPGGIGKGYAVDRIVDVLRARRVRRAMVVGGGSSIRGLGAPPDRPEGWSVLIADPRNPQRPASRVFLSNESLSTSGSSRPIGGKFGSGRDHIFDPVSGSSCGRSFSVSVRGEKAINTEAWTKPCLLRGPAWVRKHKPSNLQVLFCGHPEAPHTEWI